MKIITSGKRQLKANFHMHTTMSDGERTPAEALRAYRELGYEVAAVTDHRRVTELSDQDIPDGLLTIPSVELDVLDNGHIVHIVGLGVSRDVLNGYDQKKSTAQEAIDCVLKAGGRAVLAHPAWSLDPPELIASLRGLTGVEIWNSVSTAPGCCMRGDSSSLLDVAYSIGEPISVMANDDTHYYTYELGVGATMVEAEEMSVDSVMEALDAGRFYATQGPRFKEIELTDRSFRIACSPVERIVFYSNLSWIENRVIEGKDLVSGEYDLFMHGTRNANVGIIESFVRCQIIDANGKSAWSSPCRIHD